MDSDYIKFMSILKEMCDQVGSRTDGWIPERFPRQAGLWPRFLTDRAEKRVKERDRESERGGHTVVLFGRVVLGHLGQLQTRDLDSYTRIHAHTHTHTPIQHTAQCPLGTEGPWILHLQRHKGLQMKSLKGTRLKDSTEQSSVYAKAEPNSILKCSQTLDE